MKWFVLVVSVLMMALVAGCASTQTVKEAQGQGVTRVYQAAYDPVFDATLRAAKSKELKVVENDRATGRIILLNGVTLWSWGERIAVFVKPVEGAGTKVEIVSKPVMAPLNFPPDWQRILLDEIAFELHATGQNDAR